MAADKFIGIMSGTSADAADAVVVEFPATADASTLRLLGSASIAFPAALSAEIIALNSCSHNELARSRALGVKIARLYAESAQQALQQAGVTPQQITACAVHGQTLRHQPYEGYSIQVVELPLLAELLGTAVIGDFRGRDLAAGGQGAPLACGFHNWYFRQRPCAVLNLGGFANLTILRQDQPVLGCDCGPANVLMDAWAQKHLGKPFDPYGRWAASGECNQELLHRLQLHPFFSRSLPRSTGRDDFHLDWLMAQQLDDLAPNDVQATLLALTSWCIATTLREFEPFSRLYACGGGVNNPVLQQAIADATGMELLASDNAGVPARWMEAIAFAWLGWRHLDGLPGNLASVTGAQSERVLGCYYPA